MTTTTTDDEQVFANSGGPVPIFSGAMEDYPSWKEDILDWEHSVKLPDKVKGSRLVLAQNDVIKAIMRRAGPDNVRSAEGFNLIMKVMDSNFTHPEKDIGWYSFEKWDGMTRTKNQSSENFILQYNVAFDDVKKHDAKVSMSDQLLAMKALARLQIDDKDKTQILSRMKDPINTHTLISTIKSIYGKADVPLIAPTSAKMTESEDHALVNHEMFHSENENHDYSEDEAYWVKVKGAGKGKNFNGNKTSTIKCERCGINGHTAKTCRIDWNKIPQSIKTPPELTGAFVALCPDCGHPDCEGWDYEDSAFDVSFKSQADDDDVFRI